MTISAMDAPLGRDDDRWLRQALFLWSVFFVVFAIKTLIEPVRASVYPVFSGAARDWWAGEAMYPGDHGGYFYSPTFAVAVAPFAVLPDRFGGILWNLVNMLVLLGGLHAFVRDVAGRNWSKTTQAAFAVLVLAGSVRTMWSAQSTPLLLGLVLLGTAAIVKERWWTAAFCLAAPVYIKIWPLAVAGLLIALWPRKLSWRFLAIMLGLGLIPFATKLPSEVCGYYGAWIQALSDRHAGVRLTGYRDAWTIWEQIHPPVSHLGYMLLQGAAGVAALGWCLWQQRRGVETRRLLIYTVAVWAAWQLLFGPGTERLTYGLIAPAMAWGVVTCYLEGRHRLLIYLAMPLTYIMGAGGVERMLLKVTQFSYALQPLGIVVFAAWLVLYVRACGPVEHSRLSSGQRPKWIGRRSTNRLPVAAPLQAD